jgi:hypothetical protein
MATTDVDPHHGGIDRQPKSRLDLTAPPHAP